MATYKVLQDIEAEDKLLGPLSLRQFIYAVIVVVLGFIAFQLGRALWLLALPFVPPMVFFGLLAAPIGQNQSSEVWLLAKIRYFLLPRRRIWDQSGIQQLVTITAPKHVEQYTTKGFSQEEVKSRLQALANTLDTRGWAIKNITSGNMPTFNQYGKAVSNERLVDISSLTPIEESAAKPSDDILDDQANPVAQQMGTMIEESTNEYRQELLQKVRRLASQTSGSSNLATTSDKLERSSDTTAEGPDDMHSASQNHLASRANVVHPTTGGQAKEKAFSPQPIINNAGEIVHEPKEQKAKKHINKKTTSTMTTPANTGILDSVADTEQSSTISPRKKTTSDSDDEVVISLR